MSGETHPTHHFCPPLKAELSTTEQRAAETFIASLPDATLHGAVALGASVSLDVSIRTTRRTLRGDTLLGALANVQRLYDSLTAAPSAEAA